MNYLLQVLLWFFPWSFRRKLLIWLYNYEIAPTAHIGKSIITAKKLIMKDYARIGSFCMCKRIDLLSIGEHSSMGNYIYINGFPTGLKDSTYFNHVSNRQCVLILGNHTDVTSLHYFDCTAGITIGDFSLIAGVGSTIMTHSVDVHECIQDAAPINIGNYNFIGARSMVLKGVTTADRIVVSAMSLINRPLEVSGGLYGGVPCKYLKDISDAKYFYRKQGTI